VLLLSGYSGHLETGTKMFSLFLECLIYIRCSSHLIIWDSMRYLRSLKQASYMLFKNIEDRVGMFFGFSLYAVLLWVVLVTYFERELERLIRLGVLKSNKVCCCQH